jgi:hypothetical protein
MNILLCNFLRPPFTSSFLRQNILLSNLFSHILTPLHEPSAYHIDFTGEYFEMDLWLTGCEGEDWTELVQDWVQSWISENRVISFGFFRTKEFIGRLSSYHFSKKSLHHESMLFFTGAVDNLVRLQ